MKEKLIVELSVVVVQRGHTITGGDKGETLKGIQFSIYSNSIPYLIQ